MLFQLVLTACIFLSMWLVLRRYQQQAVHFFVMFFWLLGSCAALVVTWYPNTASILANLVGVGRGADLIVYLGILLLFVLVFQLHVSHVRLERQLTKIVREQALSSLDKRVQS